MKAKDAKDAYVHMLGLEVRQNYTHITYQQDGVWSMRSFPIKGTNCDYLEVGINHSRDDFKAEIVKKPEIPVYAFQGDIIPKATVLDVLAINKYPE